MAANFVDDGCDLHLDGQMFVLTALIYFILAGNGKEEPPDLSWKSRCWKIVQGIFIHMCVHVDIKRTRWHK